MFIGASEYVLRDDDTLTLSRTYDVGGTPVAARDNARTDVLVTDHHNTADLSLGDASELRRRTTPFGESLTNPAGWPNSRGYLNQPVDAATSTVHLGAREYDPVHGAFLAVDPIGDTGNPQQLNGYAYANASPVSSSDASGLFTSCECRSKYTAPIKSSNGSWHQRRNPNAHAEVVASRVSGFARTLSRVAVRPKPFRVRVLEARRDFMGGVVTGVAGTADLVGNAGRYMSPSTAYLSAASGRGLTYETPFGDLAGDFNILIGADLDSAASQAGGLVGSLIGPGWGAGALGRAGLSRLTARTAAKTDVGLSGRGLVAAAGTRIRPAGIPEGWRITGTKTRGGVLYRDPTNAGNSVRVMQGSPNSPFPNSQGPYVRWQRNGHPLDQHGDLLSSAKVPEAHIPLSDFRFRPEVFGL